MFYCSFHVVKSPDTDKVVHSSSSSATYSPSPSPSSSHDAEEPSVFIENTLKTNTKGTHRDQLGERDVYMCASNCVWEFIITIISLVYVYGFPVDLPSSSEQTWSCARYAPYHIKIRFPKHIK